MSADNWTICPRCKKAHAERAEQRKQKAAEAYGQVPAEEYEALRVEAQTVEELPETLREDYEIGIWTHDGDKFSVSYRGACQACAFRFDFKHEEEVTP